MSSLCSHTHIAGNQHAIEESGRADPTKTTTDQRELSRWLRGRIGQLDAAIREKVLEEDALGLVEGTFSEWSGLPAAEKARRFDEWLERQVNQTVLGNEFERKAERHLEHAAERGATDAHRELRAAGVDLGDPEETLAQDGVQGALALGVVSLAGRVQTRLDEFRSDARELVTTGLGEGVSRSQLVGDIVERGGAAKSKVTASASAEVVNQYNTTGQLSAYDRIAPELEPVLSVDVEYETAGDDRVCEQCQDLAQRDWTLEEAQNFHIPDDTHPHCRCRWQVMDVVEAA